MKQHEFAAVPPDDLSRNLTVGQAEGLLHIGLVGDTYTITLSGEDTRGGDSV